MSVREGGAAEGNRVAGAPQVAAGDGQKRFSGGLRELLATDARFSQYPRPVRAQGAERSCSGCALSVRVLKTGVQCVGGGRKRWR